MAVLIEWAVTFTFAAYATLANAGVCFEPAEPAGLRAAQRVMVVVFVVAVSPWLPVLWRTQRRLRTAAFAAAALAPITFWTGQTLIATPADFSMSWCMY